MNISHLVVNFQPPWVGTDGRWERAGQSNSGEEPLLACQNDTGGADVRGARGDTVMGITVGVSLALAVFYIR